MKKKTKWILRICVVAVLAFMACMWCLDYQSTHKSIEVDPPEVGDEVRG